MNDTWRELRRRRAGADHRDAPSGQIVVVVVTRPARDVARVAGSLRTWLL
ncbi:hypothetical protein [Nonomuraea maritima]|nr:hypothetical protein [Nonomuraea maritima]